MITALDLLFACGSHTVVAQVIEAELAVRSVRDVAGVLLTTNIRLLIVLNTANSQPEKCVKLPHPFGVAASEIIIHRYKMRAAPGESIQVQRQSRDQGFSFACRHFRNSAAVQNYSAQKLHIEVHHVPCHRLIADRETMTSLFQTPRGVFHRSERFRQNLIQPSPLFFRIRGFCEFVLPSRRFRAQSVVGQALELFVELIDPADRRRQAP